MRKVTSDFFFFQGHEKYGGILRVFSWVAVMEIIGQGGPAEPSQLH